MTVGRHLSAFPRAAMRLSCFFYILLTAPSVISVPGRSALAPQYQRLPALREQADIEDAWTDERLSKVPQLLRKYGVEAWLVSVIHMQT